MVTLPTLIDVYQAAERIQHVIRKTPIFAAPELLKLSGADSIHYKMECLQQTGAFKVRGAANKILSLTEKEKQRGVITFSTGNHGKAVAYVAGQLGIRAVVCLSENVPSYRADLIRNLGAEVAIKGQSQDEAEENYYHILNDEGLTPVVPFDDPMVIAGQGTITLEILEKLPETDMLLIPLSGGGLLSGMALAAKQINPAIKIVAISLERSPAMYESLKAGKPVQVEEKGSLADSLLGGIGVENHYNLPLLKRYIDEHILVSEDDIKTGMYSAYSSQQMIVEGAAAVGIGAIINKKIDVRGKNVVSILSGRSIDTSKYLQVIAEQQRAGEKR